MNTWLCLILSLPTDAATLRQRLWRSMNSCGAAALRDGVYLLPGNAEHDRLFGDLAQEIQAAGGTASVMQVQPLANGKFEPLFDRTAEYAELDIQLQLLRNHVLQVDADSDFASLTAQVRKLRRQFEAICRIDFFPAIAKRQLQASLDKMEELIIRRQFPNEPIARRKKIKSLSASQFQGRVWATRQRPWIDRLASAWLIRRFIDKKAEFVWFAHVKDAPRAAVGFDFDGALFTHTNDLNTFEVLVASFDLQEPGLDRLAKLVHFIDLGGISVPEAFGAEAVLAGLRASIDDDSRLQKASVTVFDGLYAQFRVQSKEK